jgi:beta-lactam-binding protein with PASTA domain
VDRHPHQRPLYDRAPLERAREVVALESGQARPEPDVRRGRVLRLDSAHALEGPWERELGALEQQLPREERAVQLPFRQHPLGHPGILYELRFAKDMYGPPPPDQPPVEPLPGETVTEVTEVRRGPEGPPGPRPPWRPDGIWFWLALLGAVAVLIVLIAILAARDDDQGASAQVPSVVGLRQARAVAVLERAGYDADASRTASAEPRGIVVDQEPDAGAALAPGGTVAIVVSSGPEVTTTVETVTETIATITVPNVVGDDHVAAGARVDGLNLIADSYPVESDQPRGTVVAQDPEAGTPVPPRTHIRLDVAIGPGERPTAIVPDVTGPNEVEARATSREAGFTVRTIDRPAPTPEERGEVILQRPAPGTEATVLTQIRIYVGR